MRSSNTQENEMLPWLILYIFSVYKLVRFDYAGLSTLSLSNAALLVRRFFLKLGFPAVLLFAVVYMYYVGNSLYVYFVEISFKKIDLIHDQESFDFLILLSQGPGGRGRGGMVRG
jgi:hypothetical protein